MPSVHAWSNSSLRARHSASFSRRTRAGFGSGGTVFGRSPSLEQLRPGRGGGPRVFGLHACVLSALHGYLFCLSTSRKLAALLTAGALCLPLAACGEDDVDQAREDVEAKAEELQGDLDDLSEEDLRNELEEVEEAAENGSDDTKREARQFERKIERELNERK